MFQFRSCSIWNGCSTLQRTWLDWAKLPRRRTKVSSFWTPGTLYWCLAFSTLIHTYLFFTPFPSQGRVLETTHPALCAEGWTNGKVWPQLDLWPLKVDPVLREASPYQNGWIFGKVPNGLWPPSPHFRKVKLRFSRQNCDKSAYVHMEEHLCILWDYLWDISHEMHVAQMFNMVIG